MNKGIFKNVLAVILGVVTGVGLIWLGEYLQPYLFPFLKGIDEHNYDAVAKAINEMPVYIFVFLLVNYAVASFAGGIIATVVSKEKKAGPSIIVGIILTIGGVLNVISIHHPLWFSIINVMEYLPFAYAGYLVAKRKRLDIKIDI